MLIDRYALDFHLKWNDWIFGHSILGSPGDGSRDII